MWAMLRQLVGDGASIVLTTHYLEEAEALADRVVVLAKGRVVASGSVNEMRALVVRTRIQCISNLAVEEVRAWPGVGSAGRNGQRLEITATNAEAVVRRLLDADQDLQELEVRRAGLAEVFTELTQEVAK
jgi:ABC-2 type transport system ATP-binding protein